MEEGWKREESEYFIAHGNINEFRYHKAVVLMVWTDEDVSLSDSTNGDEGAIFNDFTEQQYSTTSRVRFSEVLRELH